MRATIDRLVAAIARLVVLGFHRRFEVVGEPPPRDRPVLVVANHFNGFVDPVAVTAAVGRLPRFLAKATLWRIWPLRPLLALGGVIPIARRVDGSTAANTSAFAAAHRVLAGAGTVAVFPEGTTHDELELAPIRTGAARIALGARAAGISGLVVVPVGLTFEAKLVLRSRLLVRVGPPLDLDALVSELGAGPDPGEDDHAAVRALTDRIRTELGAVSPRYVSVGEHHALRLAAEVAVRPPGGESVPMAESETLAQRLADGPAADRARVVDAVARYHLELSALRLDDRGFVARRQPRRLLTGLVRTGVLVALASLFALVGVAVNAVPALAVVAAGRSVRVPVTKGTVRILVAAVAFPLAWFGVAALLVDGVGRIVLVGAGFAVAGLLYVWTAESVAAVVHGWRAWQRRTEARGVLEPVVEQRRAVVEAVASATAATR